MSTGLVEIVKRAAIDAIENGQPCDLRFGTVVGTSPLKIRISNQLVIPQSILIVPQHLTNYSVPVSLDWVTETSGEESHSHSVKGAKTLTINNALRDGDKVALLRKEGGQTYYVLDRI